MRWSYDLHKTLLWLEGHDDVLCLLESVSAQSQDTVFFKICAHHLGLQCTAILSKSTRSLWGIVLEISIWVFGNVLVSFLVLIWLSPPSSDHSLLEHPSNWQVMRGTRYRILLSAFLIGLSIQWCFKYLWQAGILFGAWVDLFRSIIVKATKVLEKSSAYFIPCVRELLICYWAVIYIPRMLDQDHNSCPSQIGWDGLTK